jgi:hypothetical protein
MNWALGLRAIGCQVVWLEPVGSNTSLDDLQAKVALLKNRLTRYGLAEKLALCPLHGERLTIGTPEGCLDLEEATSGDLLLNLAYSIPHEVVARFPRSALIDIDPGLTQIWMSTGKMNVARHDIYFTIGETVGRPGALFPDAGLKWRYTPPCVALDWWQPHGAPANAPFTTVSHWYMDEWMEDDDELYSNDKRTGFLPFLDLPGHIAQPVELALNLNSDEEERKNLEQRGWRVREAHAVASTPWLYVHYIQQSRGEFSCAKPSCVRLQNAWVSDRTLCYLASGKPAIVQHTGPSRTLSDRDGIFRFRTIEEAVAAFHVLENDYEHHSLAARRLAEEYFDARQVATKVLEHAL